VLLAGGRVVGWLIGGWLNYLPLAAHAVALARPGALAAELSAANTGAEARYYNLAQLWIFVPLAVAILAPLQWRDSRRVGPGERASGTAR
jgi:hypothetical protein